MRGALLLLATVLLPACSQPEPLALSLQSNAPEFQPLHATQYSNIREKQRLVIGDAETWAALWAEMMSTGSPSTPPYVDFQKEVVIVAAMGERRVGGYEIAIESVQFTNGAALVTVRSTSPGPTCDRAEVMTAPLDAVRMRKVSGPIAFQERAAIRECN